MMSETEKMIRQALSRFADDVGPKLADLVDQTVAVLAEATRESQREPTDRAAVVGSEEVRIATHWRGRRIDPPVQVFWDGHGWVGNEWGHVWPDGTTSTPGSSLTFSGETPQRRTGTDPMDRDEVPRVITPDELRKGQWIAYQNYNFLVSQDHINPLWIVEKYDGDAFGAEYTGTIVLLSDAPAPDPEPEQWEPSEGDVGIVTHFGGEELGEPVGAWFSGLSWYRLDRRNWPDLTPIARPSEVTVTRAKVVPDE